MDGDILMHVQKKKQLDADEDQCNLSIFCVKLGEKLVPIWIMLGETY